MRKNKGFNSGKSITIQSVQVSRESRREETGLVKEKEQRDNPQMLFLSVKDTDHKHCLSEL